MKKTILKRIKDIADTLGVKGYTVQQATVAMSGEDVLLSGFGAYPASKTIDKKATYLMDTPVLISSSFEHELKTAYRQQGEEGLRLVVQREFIRRGLHRE